MYIKFVVISHWWRLRILQLIIFNLVEWAGLLTGVTNIKVLIPIRIQPNQLRKKYFYATIHNSRLWSRKFGTWLSCIYIQPDKCNLPARINIQKNKIEWRKLYKILYLLNLLYICMCLVLFLTRIVSKEHYI